MKRILARLLGLCLLALFTAGAVHAQAPVLPHAFLGNVTINGAPAPVGTQVEGRGTGVRVGVAFNPLVTDQAGQYGGPAGLAAKLLVQGNVADGTPIEFFVNGVKAQCALPGGTWQDSFPYAAGVVTILNLQVGVAPPLPALPTVTPTESAGAPAGTTAPVTPPSAAATATRSQGAATNTTPNLPVTTPGATPDANAPATAATTALTAIVTAPTDAGAMSASSPSPTPGAVVAQPGLTATPGPDLPPTPALVAVASRAPAKDRPTSAPILPQTPRESDAGQAPAPEPTGQANSGSLLPWIGLIVVAAVTVTAFLVLRSRF